MKNEEIKKLTDAVETGDLAALKKYAEASAANSENIKKMMAGFNLGQFNLIAEALIVFNNVELAKFFKQHGANENLPRVKQSVLTYIVSRLSEPVSEATEQQIQYVLTDLKIDAAKLDEDNLSALSYCYKKDFPVKIKNMIEENFAKQVANWNDQDIENFIKNAKESKNLSGLEIVLRVKGKTNQILNKGVAEIREDGDEYLSFAFHNNLVSLVESIILSIDVEDLRANKPELYLFYAIENKLLTLAEYIYNNFKAHIPLKMILQHVLKDSDEGIGTLVQIPAIKKDLNFKKNLLSALKNTKDNEGKTLYAKAVRAGIENNDLAQLDFLSEGDLNKRMVQRTDELVDWSILEFYVFEMGRKDLFSNIFIINFCARLKNSPDRNGITPLIWLIIKNEPQIIKELAKTLSTEKEPLDPNKPDNFGNLPIIIAVQRNAILSLKALLEPPLQADPHKMDAKGRLALHEAVRLNNLEAVTALLENKADPLKKELNGYLALREARRKGNKEITELVEKYTQKAIISSLEPLIKQNNKVEAKKLLADYLEGTSTAPTRQDWKGTDEQYTLLLEAFKEVEADKKAKAGLTTTFIKELKESVGDDYGKLRKDISKKNYYSHWNVTAQLLKALDGKNIDLLNLETEFINLETDPYLRELVKGVREQYVITNALAALDTEKDVLKAQNILQKNGYLNAEAVFFNAVDKASKIEKMAYLIFGKNWAKPLFEAVRIDVDRLEKIDDRGFLNFERQDDQSKSLLHIGVEEGYITLIEDYFNNMDETASERFFSIEHIPCPVALAVKNGKSDIVRLFLEKGADPEKGLNPGATTSLLELAGDNDELKKVIQEFIDAKSKATESSEVTKPEKEDETTTKESVKKAATKKKSISATQKLVARRAAHILGLKSIKLGRETDKPVAVKLEGSTDKESVSWITDLLQNHSKLQPFNTITSAFEMANDLMQHNKSSEDLIRAYQSHNLVILPVAWSGHATCVALKKIGNETFLSFSNRGEGGDRNYGTKIYKVNTNANVEEFIRKITVLPNIEEHLNLINEKDSQLYIENCLKSVVDVNKPFDKLDQKGQKRGTCGIANRKAAIQGALYLLEYEKQAKVIAITPKSLNEKKEKIRDYSKKQYKHFTNYIRDEELEHLLEELKALKNQNQNQNQNLNTTEKEKLNEKLSFYYDILVSIILDPVELEKKKAKADAKEVNQFERKKGKQGRRILKIWEELPEEYRVHIRNEVPGFEKLKSEFQQKSQTTHAFSMSKDKEKSKMEVPTTSSMLSKDKVDKVDKAEQVDKADKVEKINSGTHRPNSSQSPK